MVNVLILQGVSGSGKSTYAARVKAECELDERQCRIVSADAAFIDAEGVYRFDPAKLGYAHATCFGAFVRCLDEMLDSDTDGDTVIVDNTNTSAVEIAPYMAAVAMHNARYKQPPFGARIMRVACADLAGAAQRNKHGVSLDAIQSQAQRIRHFDTRDGNPLRWPVEAVSL